MARCVKIYSSIYLMPIKTRNMSYLERINILKYYRYKYSDKAINIEIKLSRIYPILIFYNHEGNLINKLIRMNNHILIWKFFIFFFFFSLFVNLISGFLKATFISRCSMIQDVRRLFIRGTFTFSTF